MTSPDGIEHCVAEIGADRMLYGSGTVRYPAAVPWQMLERARISADDREKIAWRNAAKLLGVEPGPAHIPAPFDAANEPAYDIHLHDKFPAAPFPPYTAEGYAAELARNNIIGGVSSSVTGLFYDIKQGNDEQAKLTASVPNLFGYVVVDPRYLEDSARELTRLDGNEGFVGVKIHCSYAKTLTNAPTMDRLFEQIAAYGKPVLIHPLGEDWPEALVKLANLHPDLPIIAAHAGYGDGPHATHDAVLRFAESPNIVTEFCSTYLGTGAIRRGIEAVGVERVLFGTDFPLIHIPYMRAAYEDAELSADEAIRIYRTNAQRLFPELRG
jgi:predicted TIM-barrel fold metal-dependent hydrolase